jgi:hypothetical protein
MPCLAVKIRRSPPEAWRSYRGVPVCGEWDVSIHAQWGENAEEYITWANAEDAKADTGKDGAGGKSEG